MPPTRGRTTRAEAELSGVPADVVAAARAAAQAEGSEGYKLTLRMPSFLPVMQYAHNRDLRRLVHEAYSTRASDLGANPEWDNGPLIGSILAVRREEAQAPGLSPTTRRCRWCRRWPSIRTR